MRKGNASAVCFFASTKMVIFIPFPFDVLHVEINPAVAHMNNRESGVYVQSVQKDGASDGKLEVKDRLISINGYMVHTTAELSAQLAEYEPGDSVGLTVDRDGRLVEIEIILAKSQREES